jgi:hypothetical protein
VLLGGVGGGGQGGVGSGSVVFSSTAGGTNTGGGGGGGENGVGGSTGGSGIVFLKYNQPLVVDQVYTFQATSTFEVPDSVTEVDYLVVAGGGGGGRSNGGGGGGAGGFRTGTGQLLPLEHIHNYSRCWWFWRSWKFTGCGMVWFKFLFNSIIYCWRRWGWKF